MWKAGTSREVLCAVLACSTTISAFVTPVCACGPMIGRSPEATVQRQESMTPALTPRLHPCGRPCCSPDRQTTNCCCRNAHPEPLDSSSEPQSGNRHDCVGCECSTDQPALPPPSDSRLAQFQASDLSEPALSPQFAAMQFDSHSQLPCAVDPGGTVDLVVTLSRWTC